MNEHQARDRVRKLRRFYTDALIYAVVNLGLILIWAISGGGYFWPIWVIIGWGIGLGVHAFSLGLMPQLEVVVPFLTKEWEEEEVRRLTDAGYKSSSKGEKKTSQNVEVDVIIKKAKPAPQKKAPKKAVRKAKK
jgi:hypothetical protein